MYLIMGSYQDGETEEIDRFETKKEAHAMLTEYRLAFGQGWRLWVKKHTRRDNESN